MIILPPLKHLLGWENYKNKNKIKDAIEVTGLFVKKKSYRSLVNLNSGKLQ